MAYAARHLLAARPAGGGGPPPVAGYTVWYDAAQITGQADNSALAAWPDKSGNSHNLAQATGANQPLYYSSTAGKLKNGKPTVWFNGNSDYMTAATFGTPIAPPYTLMAVWGAVGTNVGNNQQFTFSTVAGVLVGVNASQLWLLYAGSAVNGVATIPLDGSQHIETAVFNDPNSTLYVDGTSLGVGTAGAVSIADFEVGGWGTNFYTNGFVCEVLIYPSALSTPNRQAVEAYLRTKWGTP